MPKFAKHPNRKRFIGVLTTVDTPSERAPSGARGHRVVLTREAAERALPSLIGMGLGYTPKLDGHDARRKIGVITGAEIIGKELVIEGHLFARDFPDMMRELRAKNGVLGLSYEVSDAIVEDMQARVWKLTDVTFTGAALLLRDKAAYGRTWFRLEDQMTAEEMKQLIATAERMAAAAEAMQNAMARIEAQNAELAQKVERIVAEVEESPRRHRDTEENKRSLDSAAQPPHRAESGLAGDPDKAASLAMTHQQTLHAAGRKTIDPVIGVLLAKSGVDVDQKLEASALDASLATLPVEQRIAVKSQLARAGLIA
jgi:hypothetical protein